MGASNTTESTQEKNPWARTTGNLQSVLDKSQSLADNTSTWTPTQSGATQAGLGQLTALGAQPSFGGDTIRNTVGQTQQGLQTGLGQLSANASGQNLDPQNNPYFRQSVGNAMQDASDMVQGQFAGAGRLGSAANTKVLTDRLGNIANTAYSNQYNTNLGYQNQSANTLAGMGLQGAGLSGQVGGLDAQQAGYGLQAGAMQDAFSQAQRMAPVQATQWQAGLTTPIASLGGTQNGTQTQTQNPGMAGLLGGAAMLGAGMMSGGASLGFSGALGGLGGLTGFDPFKGIG